MNHDGNTVGLRQPVHYFQFLEAVAIRIGVEKLVRRMNLEHADTHSQQLMELLLNLHSRLQLQMPLASRRRGFSSRTR